MDPGTTTSPGQADPGRPTDGGSASRRALTVGLVLTISVVAFEGLAVTTIVPIAARELHGLRLYGWVFSAFFLANLVGITVAGPAADRQGAARPFAAGLALFAGGLVLGGAAPTMLVLVVARAVQGLGGGAISSVAYVAISRGYPEDARPRMMALLSSAWVIPGLIGPWLAGLAADHLSWRVVFFALVATIPVAAVLALPAMRRVAPPPVAAVAGADGADSADRADLGPVRLALQLAVGAALFLAGLDTRSWVLTVAAVASGLAVAVVPLRRLMPPGTFGVRRGLPAAVAVRGLMTFGFFGTEAFVTLAITDVQDRSATAAGAAITGATLSWSAAAWVQARLAARWSRRAIVILGMACTLGGIIGASALLFQSLPAPVVVATVTWSLAGFGMGLAYPTISLAVLAGAAPGREGEATAAMQLADVLGIAVGTGVGGAAVAVVTRAGGSSAAGIAIAFALTTTVQILGVLAARRLDPARPPYATPTAARDITRATEPS